MIHLLVIVLWLLDGTPEPHALVVPPSVECDADLAVNVSKLLTSRSKEPKDVSPDFNWSCQEVAQPAPAELAPKSKS